MFVTGVSGAPCKAVVRNAPSNAGAPRPSNATAAWVSATACSPVLCTDCCAETESALSESTKPHAANNLVLTSSLLKVVPNYLNSSVDSGDNQCPRGNQSRVTGNHAAPRGRM